MQPWAQPCAPVLSVEARREFCALSDAQASMVEAAVRMLVRQPEARGTVDEGCGTRCATTFEGLQIRYGIHGNHLVIAGIITGGAPRGR